MAAREKIDPEISRKAYLHAMSKMRTIYKDEYEALIDEGYSLQGVESPRQRAARKAAEAAAAKAEKQEKRAARESAKIAEARALLAAAGMTVIDATPLSAEKPVEV
jgi:hypothetical protein